MSIGLGIGTTSAFLALTQKNIANLAWTKFNEQQDWKQVLKTVPVDASFSRLFQRHQEVVGLGAMEKWAEGTTAASDQFKMGPKKDLWMVEYGTQVTFGRRIVKTQQYPLMGQIGKELGYAANLTLNQLAAIVLDNATATTFHTGADTTALLSASHTTYGEGAASWNNIISSNAALGHAALQDSFVVGANTVNLRGFSEPIVPVRVVVPTALLNTVKSLVRSPYKPGSMDNDINTYFNELTYDVNHFMTQAAYWFTVAADHEIVIAFDEPFGTDTWTDDPTKSITTRGAMTFLHGIRTQRGWQGSTGAA